MPMQSVTLRPGVNTQETAALNEAGVSQSQLIRYKDGLIQSYGGWVNYLSSIISLVIPSTVRDLHAWQGLLNDQHLAFGATQNLQVLKVSSAAFIADVTPQTRISTNQ